MRKGMKNLLAVVLILAVVFAFTGCKASSTVVEPNASTSPEDTQGGVAPAVSEAPAESTAPTDEVTPSYVADLVIEGETTKVNMYQMVSAMMYSIDVMLDEYDFVVDYNYDCVDWKQNDGTKPYVCMSISLMEDSQSVSEVVDGLILQSGKDGLTAKDVKIGLDGKYDAKNIGYETTSDLGDGYSNFYVFTVADKIYMVEQDYFTEGQETIAAQMELMLSTLAFVE